MEGSDYVMNDLLNIIGNVGFPIAVSAYLLIRIEGKLGELAQAIAELRECIISLPYVVYRNSQGMVPLAEHRKPSGSCPPT
jgi:hypothetical protein